MVELQPGEVLIRTEFAGVPVISGAKSNPGSELDKFLSNLPANAFMPQAWSKGPMPQTMEGLADLVDDYNPQYAADLRRQGEQADIWGQFTAWANDTRNKGLLVAGAVAAIYLLGRR